MPYSGPDDDKLPDNVKTLPTGKRAQWAQVWNAAYERCQRDGGKDCEGVAFRQANGVVLKEMPVFMPPAGYGDERLSAVDLEQLAEQDTDLGQWAKRTSAKLNASEVIVEAATFKKQAQRLMKDITAILKNKTLPASLRKEIEDVRMALRKSWNDLKAQADGEEQMENENTQNALIESKFEALQSLVSELFGLIKAELTTNEAEEQTANNDFGEQSQTVELGEAAIFDAELPVSVISVSEGQNGDGLTYINVVPIRPGWGNKRDNNYYSPDLVERIAPIWDGVKMYATDHRQNEKSVLTEVSQIIKSPAGHTEDGIPYATAVIVNPQFEEIVKRRERAGILKDLHCSILAEGSARPGFELEGRKGKYVTNITEARSIDWVTRAGAGGSALSLAENDGGTQMEQEQANQEEVVEESELEESVVINEGENESAQAEEQEPSDTSTQEDDNNNADAQASAEETETPVPLTEAAVTALLPDGLPKAAKVRILAGEYFNEDDAKKFIEAEVEYLRELGSGKPFGNGDKPAPKAQTVEERNVRLSEVNSRWLGTRKLGGKQ